jgi:PAS domain S-box-containing protein
MTLRWEVDATTQLPALNGKGNGRSGEVAALLKAARAVLENRAFADAATAVLGACKTILGAAAGLVAVTSPPPPLGKGLEVTCLDSNGLDLGAVDGLPAPLRRLCARASKAGRTVVANDLAKKATKAAAAGGPAALASALVAPIVIDDEVAGLVGLFNKPKGFSRADARLAEVFAEMAAVAMLNSRTVNGFEQTRDALERKVHNGATQLLRAEETFRTLVENLPDIVARFDPDLRHLYVSPAIQKVTGRPPQDYVGKTNQELGMPPEQTDAWHKALHRVFATGRSDSVEFGLQTDDGPRRFDCRLVPEIGPEGTALSVLSVARDVTDRWLAYTAERSSRKTAEALREATLALTRSLDRETVLATLLDHLRQLVPFDHGRIMVLEEASRVSVRAIFDGTQVIPLSADERQEFEATALPILHGVLTTGAVALVGDIRAHPGWSLAAEQETEGSWMGVPLFARGAVMGALSLSKREAGYFNDEHVKLAEAMASQASVAVENAILFEQVRESTVRMRTLSRRLVDAQESERRSIARELHDEAGQALVSLRFGLRLLEREIDEGASVTARVAELRQRTDTIIEGLHSLAAGLRPSSLDHVGLEAALREYCRSAGSKLGLRVRFKARSSQGERLPTEMETALYRIVQEAVTNVVRHARATRVDVFFERSEDRVAVMIEDNGVGFEPDRVLGGSHFGLLGIQERAEALGGVLTVESKPGAGATILVEVANADPHPGG